MRIISGRLGGRNFDAPKGYRTHPMSEKARGAVFNILGDLSGLKILDPFTGSGALSFEALSRGAKFAVAIDIDNNAIKTAKVSADALGITRKVKLLRANCSTWSNNNTDQKFDIIICDPPYDAERPDILEMLSRHLLNHGIFVLSWPGRTSPPELGKLKLVKSKNQGDITLHFYKF